jgi:hypothetical protein
LDALDRGYQACAILAGEKRPFGAAWTQIHHESKATAIASFEAWQKQGATGVGLLLGKPSLGLIDVDLDHPKSLLLRDHLLPPTAMMSGRAGRPRSHCWYRVTDLDQLPATRRFRMPGGGTSIELRSTGSQTVIPPTVHPSGELYRWEGEPWGGETGPTVVEGLQLSKQVTVLAMAAVLLENWPHKGGRHDAYLALAGGLLRFGYRGINEYWEKNLPTLIGALADASHDEEGRRTRISEAMGSTMERLRLDGKAVGFPRLAELIGADHAEAARRLARDMEQLAGFTEEPPRKPADVEGDYGVGTAEAIQSTLEPEVRNPVAEKLTSWGLIDLEPYLTGQVEMPPPTVLLRGDGKGLMYPGRVNSLYGKSESAKSWIALFATIQEIAKGERTLYIDLEDGPIGTIDRLKRLGAGVDDLREQFRYINPDGPLSPMERGFFGKQETDEGKKAHVAFEAMIKSFDPTLIVVDGMTVLYGLHGLNTNDATATEIITGWLKKQCRGGRNTVIVIDHTGKGDTTGASPIGAHQKVAMVQGTALRVDVIEQPRPGSVGRMNLVVHKDRPGSVREFAAPPSGRSNEQIAAVVTLDSTVPPFSRMTIDAPDPKAVAATSDSLNTKWDKLGAEAEWQNRVIGVLQSLDDGEWLHTRKLYDQLGLTGKDDVAPARDAWGALYKRGSIERKGNNNKSLYVRLPPKADAPDSDSG